MKLDVDVLRYLSKEDFRVLTAVELGMRNVRLSLSLTFLYLQLLWFYDSNWIASHSLNFSSLQHELVPTELIDRIARLKYVSVLFFRLNFIFTFFSLLLMVCKRELVQAWWHVQGFEKPAQA